MNELFGSTEDKSIARAQIRQTILSHFEKEKLLYYRGIKVLSLFFIDEVAKYKIYDESGNPTNGEYGNIFEEPVRFIFSHSALREGWDNPNIFQICTLKKNNSDISKRQEIGRGMRICVNQDGIRQDSEVLDSEFHSVNKLTVIASESYDEFARSLQAEMLKSLSRKSYKKMNF